MPAKYIYGLVNLTLVVSAFVLSGQGRSFGFVAVVIGISALMVNLVVYFSRRSSQRREGQGKKNRPSLVFVIGIAMFSVLLYVAGDTFLAALMAVTAGAFLVLRSQIKSQ